MSSNLPSARSLLLIDVAQFSHCTNRWSWSFLNSCWQCAKGLMTLCAQA